MKVRFLERRKLGLTARGVIEVLQFMESEGSLRHHVSVDANGEEAICVSGLAVDVARRLAEKKPDAWADIDWDNVLAWIEGILELLVTHLPLIIELLTSIH